MSRNRGRRHERNSAGLDQLGPTIVVKYYGEPLNRPHFKGLNERARVSTAQRGVKVTLVDHDAFLKGGRHDD